MRDVDECAQAIVLAEIAARCFVARGAVFDLADGIEANECRLLAIPPQAQRFLRRADCARFAAVLVHDDFWLRASGAKAVADEIDLGLYDREIVLRSALQYESRTKRREIGNAGDVEEHILRQHRGQSGENLLRAPTLALKVDDIGLHEHRAAVAEHRHGLRREGEIGILRHVKAEALGGRLQEISIARRALRVQLEVLHAAVVQDDDLDVLPANVDDHVRIFVELQRRLGMSDGLNQCNVGVAKRL